MTTTSAEAFAILIRLAVVARPLDKYRLLAGIGDDTAAGGILDKLVECGYISARDGMYELSCRTEKVTVRDILTMFNSGYLPPVMQAGGHDILSEITLAELAEPNDAEAFADNMYMRLHDCIHRIENWTQSQWPGKREYSEEQDDTLVPVVH